MEPIINKDFEEFSFHIQRALDNNPEVKEALEKAKAAPEEKPEAETSETAIVPVSSSGLGLTNTGEFTRAELFNLLDDKINEDYKDLVVTPEQARKISSRYKSLSIGAAGILPMLCTADKCPFNKFCPYYEEGIAPIGKPCPVEAHLFSYHTKKFIEEYDIQPHEHSDLQIAQELAELMILEMRANMHLASDGAAMFQINEKISKDGVSEEIVEHWAFKVKETIKNRRMKILDAMIGTRKAKAAVAKIQGKAEDDVYRKLVTNVLDKVTAKAINPVEFEVESEIANIIDEIEKENK